MDQDGNPQIRDFFIDETPKQFRVHRDGEVFEAPAVLGPAQMVELVGVLKTMGSLAGGATDPDSAQAALKAIGDVFTGILTADSGPKFAALLIDRTRPIDLKRQLMPILQWLLEEYGLRPTTASPASSNTSTPTDAGTNSTDGPPLEESTPAL